MRVYTADFETNNSQFNIECDSSRVWLYDLCSIAGFEHRTGTTIQGFFETLYDVGGGIVYFHNLKFDGQFILHYLLRNKFKYSNKKKLMAGEFSALISDRGIYYSIKACIGVKSRKRVIVEFRDSSKKINGSIERIAVDYNLPVKKGEIDYNLYRPIGHTPTEDEVAYIVNDTEIPARVLADQYNADLTRLTTSADSLAKFKESLHGRYRDFFPVVDYDVDCFLRRAYRGGVVQVNKSYQGIEINAPVHCYDVNSMYPAVMVTALLPYGVPLAFTGAPHPTKAHPLYIVEVNACFKLKRGHIPTLLQKQLGFRKIEYVADTHGVLDNFTLTNVDLELLQEHYEIYEIEYVRGYYFRGSKKLFTEYILPLYKTKSEAKGSVKLQAKLLMNSLYGKFGSNPKHIERVPYLDDGYKLSFKNGETTIEEPEFTAMACFITAYARRKLFDAIHANIGSFVYCDTDSVHLTSAAHGLDIDDKRLGAWALEKVYVKSKYLFQKTYIGQKDSGEMDIRICGAPKETKRFVNFENFKTGATFGGKLVPHKAKGGVILIDTTFTIKER